MVLAEAVVSAPVTESVQVLRGGQARAYIIAKKRSTTTDRCCWRPGAIASAGLRHPPKNGQAAAVAVPEVAGILQVRDLTVTYGPKKAVDTVSLEIRRGEIFGLLGPNGAGKTSTLSAIEGLVKPQSGKFCSTTWTASAIPTRRGPEWACSFRDQLSPNSGRR